MTKIPIRILGIIFEQRCSVAATLQLGEGDDAVRRRPALAVGQRCCLVGPSSTSSLCLTVIGREVGEQQARRGSICALVPAAAPAFLRRRGR
jgi:hypothetical protein